MEPIRRAIFICGSIQALARACGGKTRAETIRYWLREGVAPKSASLLEAGVDRAIAKDSEAAERASKSGGRVLVEQLCPKFRWERDASGAVAGWFTVDPRSKRKPSAPHRPRPFARKAAAPAPAPRRSK